MPSASRLVPRAAAFVALPAALWIGAAALDDANARAAQPSAPGWYRGNTHTHTLNSDGDSSPDEVVRWYREHGYSFLVLSDHNFLTSVDGLNALMGADERFLVLRGEEVTDRFQTKPIHVNGLDVRGLVQPQGGSSVLETVQRNVDAIRAAGGVPSINHPNFGWAITADELAQVRNNRLFEIFNGHPMVNNMGGGGVPGLEEAWDAILTKVTSKAITVVVRQRTFEKYRIRFIGGGGRLLKEATSSPASYEIAGTEGYVRAKVIASNGQYAWTQPVVVGK